MKWGWFFQPGALWIGAHYSEDNRRWCINVLPCCTIWIALEGGKVPRKAQACKRAPSSAATTSAQG